MCIRDSAYPFNLGEGKLANAEENDIWYYKGEAFRGLGNEQQAIDLSLIHI